MNRTHELADELMNTIFSLHRSMHRMNADEFCDLSPLQMYTLLILHENGSCTMQELAKQQKIAPASMTAQIDRLIKKNLIERHTDKNDGRVVRVSMSEAGKAELKDLYAKKHEKTRDILSILSLEEQESLVASMKKIEAHFQKMQID